MSTTRLSLNAQMRAYIKRRFNTGDFEEIVDVYEDADRIFTPTDELRLQAIRDSLIDSDENFKAGRYFTAEQLLSKEMADSRRASYAEIRARQLAWKSKQSHA